jgi:hypothetical protein
VPEVVVADPEIQYELAADLPVVLNEHARLVHLRDVLAVAEDRRDLAGPPASVPSTEKATPFLPTPFIRTLSPE